jgi:predicted HNH restriction endonuclease
LLPPVDAQDESAITTGEALDEEGRMKLTTHYAIERSSRNRRIVLKGRPQPYACDACDLSLHAYGPEYGALIHVHHRQPVGQRVKNPKTEDFLLLCPNCHGVAHWGRALNPLGIAALRELAAAARAKWTGKS